MPLRAPELKVTGSRFIADLIPASSKEEVESALDRIRKEFYDATHHCYAYRLGINGELTRAADDGEPSGTAGKPILTVLTGAQLTNILCVVTRYFGGTKLGTGGLVRAYSEATKLAIDGVKTKEVFIKDSIIITSSYEDHPLLERFLAGYSIQPRESDFSDKVILKIDVRRSLAQKFREDIQEKFFGKVTIERG
jgi:uncharacterized YigZ family protein